MTKAYQEAGKRLLKEGVWSHNKRTDTKTLAIHGVNFEYDVGKGEFPMPTTRKMGIKWAINEFLGYLRGYDSAKQFRELGCGTWDANANKTKAWLANPNRKGEDDMGRVYGVQARDWINRHGEHFDQLVKVYNNIIRGIDDRGEIITFWNPGEFKEGCLRPCMHTHHFSLIGDTLHLDSYQRSADGPIGTRANQIQCYVFLALMAQITGWNAGKVFHRNVNFHLYEEQYELFKMEMEREPRHGGKLIINDNIKTLDDVLTWVSADDFSVVGYEEQHPAIQYPFAE